MNQEAPVFKSQLAELQKRAKVKTFFLQSWNENFLNIFFFFFKYSDFSENDNKKNGLFPHQRGFPEFPEFPEPRSVSTASCHDDAPAADESRRGRENNLRTCRASRDDAGGAFLHIFIKRHQRGDD